MGELHNCSRCGKIFVKVSQNICPDCIREEEEKFELVRKHLKDNPGASVEEISEEFDVEEKIILKWLREGRLQGTKIDASVACQSCGTPISFGNLCSECSRLLAAQLSDATKSQVNPLKEEEEKPQRRMFIRGKEI